MIATRAGRMPFNTPRRMSRRHPTIHELRVVKKTGGWALMVDDLDEPAWCIKRRANALRGAKEAARYHRCRLQIYKTDGSLHSETDFGASA